MPRRVRRPLALLVAPVLLVPALVACGSDDGAESSGDGLSAVTVSGEVGSEPEVEWDGDFTAGSLETETLVEGDGPTIEDDSSALVQYWIGNGYDEKKAISTYDDGGKAEVLDLSNADLPEALTEPLVGQTVGSRVVASVSADELFGDIGNPQYGISNKDPLLLVFDILGPYEVGVPFSEKGTAWVPDLVLDDDGQPEAMRFMGRPKPTGGFLAETVVKGGGPEVERGDTVMVDYIGEVYAKPKPFDSSFDATPTTFPLEKGGLIDGWLKGLAGQTVGSRVWLQIPPELGYGAEGNEGAKIKGTDTLYFLIDILGVA